MINSTALANIVSIFHFSIILFIIVIPFTKVFPAILFIHILLCISIILHWLHNSNVCSLSILEAKLRGIPYTKSYTHSIISPIYDISKTQWSKICYIIIIFLMGISMINILKSENLKLAKIYYNKHKTGKTTFFERIKLLLRTSLFMFTNNFEYLQKT